MSSPNAEALRTWRLFFESSLVLMDVLEAELEDETGVSFRWYDVLVQLEEAPQGIPMNQLAERILYSKSGLTRVIDRMEEAGLVERVRPDDNRRTILVVLTDLGNETKERARRYHHDGIERHFARHLSESQVRALGSALEEIMAHARSLRPGRIGSKERPS